MTCSKGWDAWFCHKKIVIFTNLPATISPNILHVCPLKKALDAKLMLEESVAFSRSSTTFFARLALRIELLLLLSVTSLPTRPSFNSHIYGLSLEDALGRLHAIKDGVILSDSLMVP